LIRLPQELPDCQLFGLTVLLVLDLRHDIRGGPLRFALASTHISLHVAVLLGAGMAAQTRTCQRSGPFGRTPLGDSSLRRSSGGYWSTYDPGPVRCFELSRKHRLTSGGRGI
jgi:hypothetical protein